MFGWLVFTVPTTETFREVAPVLEWLMLPATDPSGALPAMRTCNCAASEPSNAGSKVATGPKTVPSVLISKLAGAVIVTTPERLLPVSA